MPGAGAYSYLKQLLVGRPIPPRHFAISRHPAIVLLRLVAALGTTAIVSAAALILWLAPWPVDVLIAVGAAAAWTSWLDREEPE